MERQRRDARHVVDVDRQEPHAVHPQLLGKTRVGTDRGASAGWTAAGHVHILGCVTFRERLVATIRAAQPVLELPDVLVVGSQVPNLLEPDAAATLVVSVDLDVGVPVQRHGEVKARLAALTEFTLSPDEPSVLAPVLPHLLELNFVGIDLAQDPDKAYALDDDRLPLMVFGPLSLVRPGREVNVEGVRVRLPRVAGLLLEKLVTDRTGDKGERDLLVALGLLTMVNATDVDELDTAYRALPAELRHAVRSNLTLLSLLEPRAGMPDPRPWRADVATLLGRLESPGRSEP